ncbi:MgtC/SapB family protein [Winogradskyella ursingii]|uniref:MgtC/SapB family protein n=1 Tax=Winogradskyella ursingii TaxID=2686079 RepID=UPI0015C8DEC6|nr:MgtC/SapB family protein [Winogradskyella ursingii]
MNEINHIDFIISLVAAMVAGVVIGIERQMKKKNAGLKTNALVAVGAAIFVNISYSFMGLANVDNSRIVSQVIIGVGFLGAGVIMKREKHISGLATAASIWCSAGLGCLAALKMYVELATATILIVSINLIFGYLNHYIYEKNKNSET